jgi:hypothetical protein
VNCDGTSVAAISAAVALGGCSGFHGLSPRANWAAYRRAPVVDSSASASRFARSRITTIRVPWRLPPLGANRALSRIRSSTSSGRASPVNSRTAAVVRMTS